MHQNNLIHSSNHVLLKFKLCPFGSSHTLAKKTGDNIKHSKMENEYRGEISPHETTCLQIILVTKYATPHFKRTSIRNVSTKYKIQFMASF